MLRVGCISVGYPNFRCEIAEENLRKSLDILHSCEIELTENRRVLNTEPEINRALLELGGMQLDLLVLELGTYSYGSALLTCLERMKGVHLVLWGFREPILLDCADLPLNSLCALNMYTSFLKKLNRRDFSYLYGNPEEESVVKELKTILKAAAIKKELREAKFCIIGGRVPGFYLSNVDELRFRNEIGPELVYYSVASLIHDAGLFSQEEVEGEVLNFSRLVGGCQASVPSLRQSARIYLAMKQFAAKEGICGFAVKCWPDFQELLDTAVCGVVSRLNQEGLLTSCEGDVTGLATMFMQSRLTDKPVFLTDLVNITEEGIVKLWHCGCASPRLAAEPEHTEYGWHPTMKGISGVASSFDLMPGRVLLCKLSEDTPYKLLWAEGECQRPDRVLKGNQGDIRFGFDSRRLLDMIVGEGIEHHYSMAYDCDGGVLKVLCGMMGIRLLTVE